ncbi:hypothetical protein FRC02_011272 [Tulasnella sp. 418]|nr:hypothetical protein FRC02_011272 [Tulasnella sp. 418]
MTFISGNQFGYRCKEAQAAVCLPLMASLTSIPDENSWIDPRVPIPRNTSEIPIIPDETLFGPGTTPIRPSRHNGAPKTPLKARRERGHNLVRGWVHTLPLQAGDNATKATAASEYVLDWVQDQASQPSELPSLDTLNRQAARAVNVALRVDPAKIVSDEDWDLFSQFSHRLLDFAFWDKTLYADQDLDFKGAGDQVPEIPFDIESMVAEFYDPQTAATGSWVYFKPMDNMKSLPNEQKPSFLSRCVERIKGSNEKKKHRSKFVQKLRSLGAKLF